MRLIGLTGGIGSGKSTVAEMFQELGCSIVDADQLGRDVVKKGQPALNELVEAFGKRILTDQKELNRPLVASIVFNDSDSLKVLNNITHREIRRLQKERISEIYQKKPEQIVIYDAALLVEMGLVDMCQSVILVEADEEIRIQRLIDYRGLSLKDAQARIRNQLNDAEKKEYADFIINNSKGIDFALYQVKKVFSQLVQLPSLTFDQIQFP